MTAHLEPVRLTKGQVLYEAGDTVRHAYLPVSGMVSVLSMTKNGDTVEMAMVGNEGMIGVPHAAPARLVHQAFASIRWTVIRLDMSREAKLFRYRHNLTPVTQSAGQHSERGASAKSTLQARRRQLR